MLIRKVGKAGRLPSIEPDGRFYLRDWFFNGQEGPEIDFPDPNPVRVCGLPISELIRLANMREEELKNIQYVQSVSR